MTKIVASLVERNVAGVADSSREAFRAGADLVEVRLDRLDSVSEETIREVREVVRGPVIATLRSRGEGGRSPLTGAARERKLWEIVESDFECVDLELATDSRSIKAVLDEEWRPEMIVSAHFSKAVKQATVERKLRLACDAGDLGKVAMHCDSAADALMLARVAKKFARWNKRFVLIGMGAQGMLTRVCAKRLGSELAYACIPGKQAAPGQLDVATQRELLTDDLTILGLLGHPVSHSVSRPMQESALSEAGLVGAYVPMDFPAEDLEYEAVKQLIELGFKGLNVTIPHKGWAYRISTKRGASATATKAVNTLKFTRENIIGENTDVCGFSKLIERKTHIDENTRCFVIGAGGASRAVVNVLRGKGAQVTITDVDMGRAVKLAKMFKCRASTPGEIWRKRQSFEVVVNCSPVGMKGSTDESPVKPWVFRPGAAFFDIIFNPPRTKAMRLAAKQGAQAHGGLEMLVQQGAESFRIWTGLEPNIAAMRESARRALT